MKLIVEAAVTERLDGGGHTSDGLGHVVMTALSRVEKVGGPRVARVGAAVVAVHGGLTGRGIGIQLGVKGPQEWVEDGAGVYEAPVDWRRAPGKVACRVAIGLEALEGGVEPLEQEAIVLVIRRWQLPVLGNGFQIERRHDQGALRQAVLTGIAWRVQSVGVLLRCEWKDRPGK